MNADWFPTHSLLGCMACSASLRACSHLPSCSTSPFNVKLQSMDFFEGFLLCLQGQASVIHMMGNLAVCFLGSLVGSLLIVGLTYSTHLFEVAPAQLTC